MRLRLGGCRDEGISVLVLDRLAVTSVWPPLRQGAAVVQKHHRFIEGDTGSLAIVSVVDFGPQATETTAFYRACSDELQRSATR